MSRRAFISARLRRFTAERARHRCEYCWLQQELCPESFEVDHIIPSVWRPNQGSQSLLHLSCLQQRQTQSRHGTRPGQRALGETVPSTASDLERSFPLQQGLWDDRRPDCNRPGDGIGFANEPRAGDTNPATLGTAGTSSAERISRFAQTSKRAD